MESNDFNYHDYCSEYCEEETDNRPSKEKYPSDKGCIIPAISVILLVVIIYYIFVSC